MLNMTSEHHLGRDGRMGELELGVESEHKPEEAGKQGQEWCLRMDIQLCWVAKTFPAGKVCSKHST